MGFADVVQARPLVVVGAVVGLGLGVYFLSSRAKSNTDILGAQPAIQGQGAGTAYVDSTMLQDVYQRLEQQIEDLRQRNSRLESQIAANTNVGPRPLSFSDDEYANST